jgi:hypothetical protein
MVQSLSRWGVESRHVLTLNYGGLSGHSTGLASRAVQVDDMMPCSFNTSSQVRECCGSEGGAWPDSTGGLSSGAVMNSEASLKFQGEWHEFLHLSFNFHSRNLKRDAR